MKLKVAVNENRIPSSYNFHDDLFNCRLYYDKHGVEIEWTVKDIDVIGYQSIWDTQLHRYLIEYAYDFINLDKSQDVNMFVFDQSEWHTPPGSMYPLLPETPNGYCKVIDNKPFCCVGAYSIDELKGVTSNQVKHELMHALVRMAWNAGFQIPDVMDTYRLNEYPDNPLSNFSQQWQILKPFIDFMNSDIINNMTILKYKSRGDDVKKLQIALGITADGIFGYDTIYALKEFQKAHNLTNDGIAGPLTLKALGLLQPKTLLDAIIQVESGGDDMCEGDITLANHAYGALQIRQGVCDDINAKFKTTYKSKDCLGNRALSIEIWNKYWQVYPDKQTDEDKARTWNGGPGWKKIYFSANKTPAQVQYCKNIDAYWKNVSALL